MKNIYITAFLLSIGSLLSAQIIDTNWVRQYDRVSSYSKVQIAELPSGNYLLAQQDKYYKINLEGDSLAAQVENTSWGTTSDMVGIGDGVMLAGTLGGAPGFAKMDTNFNIVWSKTLGYSNGEAAAIFADGSDYFVSGYGSYNSNFVAKFDANGDTAWMFELQQTTFTKLSDIIKLSDGNYLASGNLDDYPLAVKFNSDGDTLWTYYEPLFISFQKMNAFEKANGNIVLMAERYIIELDEDGVKLSQNDFSNSQFYDLHFENDTFYLFGSERISQSGNDRYPIVELRNASWDSLGKWTLTNGVYPIATNEFSDAIKTPGGGYIAVGKLQDSVNISNNTYNVLAVKFNDGLAPDTTDTLTGLSRVWANQQLNVYPNPVDQVLNVSAVSAMSELKLIDIQGRVVLRKQVATKQETLDMEALESGFYLLQVDGGAPQSIIKY